MKYFALLLVTPLLALPACKDEQKCEKARLASATDWERVKIDAGRFKFQGVAGYDDLSPTQKKTHHDAWTEIEANAQIVFESFAFSVIAWDNATTARTKVEKEFDGYFQKEKYSGFRGQLDAALKSFSEAEAACR
jgi:hypothetical protein